jgi:hypothetical protein
LETIDIVLDLSPSGRTVSQAPDLAGLTELEQLRQTRRATFAAIAQRSKAICQRLARASQDTDAVAMRLADALFSTASHLQRTPGRALDVSGVSITDLSDELLAARVENNHRARRRTFAPPFCASLLRLPAAAGAVHSAAASLLH